MMDDQPNPIPLPPDIPPDPSLSYKPPPVRPSEEVSRTLPPDPATMREGSPWMVSMDFELRASGEVAKRADAAHYILRSELGRGGFGEVWEGVQVSLGRVVAIKRPRADFAATRHDPDGHEFRQYAKVFRQEAVTAATLDHPNIVPIYDLGADAEGTPLLAMKLVRGEPWDKLLATDFDRCTPDEHLARNLPILVSVSQAVAFAHSRGVVHRDLKPSQVMIGEFGEVLLMDWGLAIAHDPKLATSGPEIPLPVPLATRDSATNPAGTVAYMAPEQTLPSATEVGPWTDVYLLGGILYQILTGKPPHWANDVTFAWALASAGVVNPLAEAAPNREQPHELVELAMRALEASPKRRPASAREFIDGLREYLTGATHRADSRKLVEEAAAALERARGEYRAFNDAGNTLDRARLLWPANPDVPPLRDRLSREFARAALEHGDLVLARMQAERLSDPKERRDLLAEIDTAEHRRAHLAHQRRVAYIAAAACAVALLVGAGTFVWRLDAERATAVAERDAARAARAESDDLVGFMLGDLRARVAKVDPKLEALDEVAQRALEYLGTRRWEERSPRENERLYRGLSTLANVFRDQGNFAMETKANDASLELARRLRAEDPDSVLWLLCEAESHHRIGYQLASKGELKAAIESFTEARRLMMPHVERPTGDDRLVLELSKLYANLAQCRERSGDIAGAAADAAEACALRERRLKAEPDSIERQSQLASALQQHAQYLDGLGKTDEALALLNRSLEVSDGIIAAKVDDASIIANLRGGYVRAGQRARDAGDLARAQASFERARDLSTRSAELQPENLSARANVGRDWGWIATVREAQGNYDGSLEALAEYRSTFEQLCARDPLNTYWTRDLAVAFSRTGTVLLAKGDASAAHDALERVLDLRASMVASAPDNPGFREELGYSWGRLADAEVALGDLAAAEASMLKGLEMLSSLARDLPTRDQTWWTLLDQESKYSKLLVDDGRADEAPARFRALAALVEGFMRDGTVTQETGDTMLVLSGFWIAAFEFTSGDVDGAWKALADAAPHGQLSPAELPDYPHLQPIRDSDPARFDALLMKPAQP